MTDSDMKPSEDKPLKGLLWDIAKKLAASAIYGIPTAVLGVWLGYQALTRELPGLRQQVKDLQGQREQLTKDTVELRASLTVLQSEVESSQWPQIAEDVAKLGAAFSASEEKLKPYLQWVGCQDKEEQSGRDFEFVWSTLECLEVDKVSGKSGSRPAVGVPAPQRR